MQLRTDKQPFTSIPEAIRHHAKHSKSSTIRILGSQDTTLSYEDLWQLSGRCVTALTAKGIRPKDRVALSMVTSAEVIIVVAALMRLGATIVPLLHRPVLRPGSHDSATILSGLRAGRANWCLVEEKKAPLYQEMVKQYGLSITVISLETATDISYIEASFIQGQLSDDSPALLQFSAGSTAAPKGIHLTQRNLTSNISAIIERIQGTGEDRIFSWLPLYHDMGLVGALLTSLYAGSTLVLDAPSEFIKRPLGWIEALSRFNATITMAPQFAYNLCLIKSRLAWKEIAACNLSSLRLAFNGGEAVHYVSCLRFEEQFALIGLRPHVIQPSYGLAENCLAVTLRVPESPIPVRHFSRAALTKGKVELLSDPSTKAVTAVGNGTPVTGTEINICSRDGSELTPGRVGEIYISGAATTTMLADNEGDLHPASGDGWVATGDIGALIDGEMYVIGRVKEIFKKGGRTFVPNDIENALTALPSILPGRVAAINVYDDSLGDEELIVIVEFPGRRDQEIAQTLADQIRLLVLREFQIRLKEVIVTRLGSIPKTSSGKIKRYYLRDAYSKA